MKHRDLQMPGIDKSIKYIAITTNREGIVCLDARIALEQDLIIGYCPQADIYIAWNNIPHRSSAAVIKGETHQYTLPRKTNFLCNTAQRFNEIYPVYKNLQSSRHKEKVVLIKPTFIKRFCMHPFAYLLPDEEDEEFAGDTLFGAPNMQNCILAEELLNSNNYCAYEERKLVSCKKVERDYRFRELVFGKYSTPHCIICGLEHLNTLQAAHIIAVQDGGDDIPENGIVLCANHHLMYDAKDFEIDFSTGEIKVKNNAAEKYMSFESNNGSILK